jgi:polyferredoxin
MVARNVQDQIAIQSHQMNDLIVIGRFTSSYIDSCIAQVEPFSTQRGIFCFRCIVCGPADMTLFSLPPHHFASHAIPPANLPLSFIVVFF